MKKILIIPLLLGLVACANTPPPMTTSTKKPRSQFQEVWQQISSDPVSKLPQQRVSYRQLFSKGKDIILGNSRRTLNEHADIIPSFNKLAHPNGVCFKGVWQINQQNPYSGYFKQNSKALIIVRASTAMSNTRSGEIRAFGFAGKLFPTLNPNKVNPENTANFFLIDDLGGTRAKHYTDVTLTNEPSVSKNSEVLKNLLYALKVARTFSKADKNPGIRQVYEISYLGEANNKAVITPRWMKVSAQAGQTRDAQDFRDELAIKDKPLIFDIAVASKKINNKKVWQNIGTITLDASVVSTSCDHRLHFHHPKWRDDVTK